LGGCGCDIGFFNRLDGINGNFALPELVAADP
jgi:hypothetical protein